VVEVAVGEEEVDRTAGLAGERRDAFDLVGRVARIAQQRV
jgi:hypothetical protein